MLWLLLLIPPVLATAIAVAAVIGGKRCDRITRRWWIDLDAQRGAAMNTRVEPLTDDEKRAVMDYHLAEKHVSDDRTEGER